MLYKIPSLVFGLLSLGAAQYPVWVDLITAKSRRKRYQAISLMASLSLAFLAGVYGLV
jgi:hypothetical protein